MASNMNSSLKVWGSLPTLQERAMFRSIQPLRGVNFHAGSPRWRSLGFPDTFPTLLADSFDKPACDSILKHTKMRDHGKARVWTRSGPSSLIRGRG